MITWIQVCATKKEEEEFREDGGVYKKKVQVCGRLSDRIWTLVSGVQSCDSNQKTQFSVISSGMTGSVNIESGFILIY